MSADCATHSLLTSSDHVWVCCLDWQGMRPPSISQLVNVTQSVMPTYMPTMTAPTTYQTMLTPASGTTVVSTAATYQQQQAAMLAALQLQQLSMYLHFVHLFSALLYIT